MQKIADGSEYTDVRTQNPRQVKTTTMVAHPAMLTPKRSRLPETTQDVQKELTQAYDATVEGWAYALELRDMETKCHTQRVTTLTLQLARALKVAASEIVHIRRGALLHDIGKMGIPDSILHKPDRLSEAEWEEMRRHPIYAYEMLASIPFLKPALEIPYCHHEKWDGTGYPRGLKGEEIPLAARLFAVVDVWDALCSNRPYRRAWSKAKVRQHIRSLSGTHFDPQVVEVFLNLPTIRAAVPSPPLFVPTSSV